MSPNQSAIDPRARRTRRLLFQAFKELLHEKGFDDVTVQDIAERAEVNRATFYAHFEDKTHLLDSFVRSEFQVWLDDHCPTCDAMNISNLSTLTLLAFQFLALVHDQCRPRPSDKASLLPSVSAGQQELYDLILDWLQRPTPPNAQPPAPPETAAAVASWAIVGTGVKWSWGTRTPDAETIASQVSAVIGEGLLSPIGEPAAGLALAFAQSDSQRQRP